MIQIFLNPLSNNKKGVSAQSLLKEKFAGQEINFFDVTKEDSVTNIVKDFNNDDVIVLAGGDGTLNRFVNDIYELHIQQKFLYLPSGSGNDFLNDIKESATFENGMVVMNEFIQSLPVVNVNGLKRYYLNGIGYGIDGYCCQEGDKIRATSDKKVNYTTIALKGVLGGYKTRNAVVTVDGVTKSYTKVWLAPAMLGRFYGGGMMIAPAQKRLNPERTISCVIAHDCPVIKLLAIFPKIYSGKHVSHTDVVDFISGHEITVEFDVPCALQIDGETVLDVKTFTASYK